MALYLAFQGVQQFFNSFLSAHGVPVSLVTEIWSPYLHVIHAIAPTRSEDSNTLYVGLPLKIFINFN